MDSEEDMLALAEKAAEHGLVNYVAVWFEMEKRERERERVMESLRYLTLSVCL